MVTFLICYISLHIKNVWWREKQNIFPESIFLIKTCRVSIMYPRMFSVFHNVKQKISLHQIVSVFNFYYVNWNFLGAKFNELNRSLNYKFTQLVHILNQESNFSFWDGDLRFEPLRQWKAECCSWWTIILQQERTELSRTNPLFRKKNETQRCILKNIGRDTEKIGMNWIGY